MDLTEALTFVTARSQGTVVTIKESGRPQLSNIFYVAGDDGALRISITDTRAKTPNIRRDPRVSLYVLGDNFFQWVVLECTAELSPVTTDPHDATADMLVDYYRAGSGEHPDWEEYRAAMVSEKRLILTLRPERAYGILPG